MTALPGEHLSCRMISQNPQTSQARTSRLSGIISKQHRKTAALLSQRWIQCEEAISEFGYLAKHPTTGNAIASPYVSMSRDYKKQVNADWFQIYQIVRENCSVEYDGSSPQDDVMERLLRARNRK